MELTKLSNILKNNDLKLDDSQIKDVREFLYAIAHMGCATKDTIVAFLTAIANKYPDLHIVCGKENINERLRFMYGLGLVQKIFYDVFLGPNKKQERITLYITTEDGVGYVKLFCHNNYPFMLFYQRNFLKKAPPDSSKTFKLLSDKVLPKPKCLQLHCLICYIIIFR